MRDVDSPESMPCLTPAIPRSPVSSRRTMVYRSDGWVGGGRRRANGLGIGCPPVSETADGRGRTVVVIGEGDLTDEVATALESDEARVNRLLQPDENEVRKAIQGDDVDSVCVVAREDPFVLRMALIVRSVSKEVPLVLTIFDETMAEHVARDVPNTRVTSLADIVAPSLAGPCIEEHATAVSVEGDDPVLLVEEGGEVSEKPVPQLKARRIEALSRALFTP